MSRGRWDDGIEVIVVLVMLIGILYLLPWAFR